MEQVNYIFFYYCYIDGNNNLIFTKKVHNNYEDPLIYLQKNELPQYTYETNGLKDIKFQNTHKEFLKLNSIYIFYQNVNICNYNEETTQIINPSQSISNNKHQLNKTKKIY